ncbi:MAG: sortase, partial [Anaerolineales bacterium]
PEDVPMPQSPHNNTSNERYYLPTADVQIRTLERTAEVTVPLMPLTGFPPNRVTSLPAQPADQAYTALSELWLEIPKLKVSVPIVGIPPKGKEWDLTWLWDQAGWLEGTAFPTHQGNAALTAHAYLPSGLPGPFARLSELLYGDRLIIHLGGQRYIFEVREVSQVLPNSLSAFRHEAYPWLTLITCKEYDERLKQYRYRVIVRAVLVTIEDE